MVQRKKSGMLSIAEIQNPLPGFVQIRWYFQYKDDTCAINIHGDTDTFPLVETWLNSNTLRMWSS